MKFSKIQKVAAVVMMVCGFVLSSCQPETETPAPEITMKESAVDSKAGSRFVSVKCQGEWTISIEYTGEQKDWASVSPSQGTGDKNNIILSFTANDSESARELRLILESGSMPAASYVLTQTGVSDSPEKPDEPVMPDDPKDTATVDLSAMSWLELPEINPESGLEYYSHSFEMDGDRYRNYSFGWSQGDLVALWVAYPLCKFYTNKSVNRTNAWAYDPLLGPENSPAPFGGYGGSYARGHQLPSADRLCCYDANAQTFYGSNMTPQLNQHNEGIWATLEGMVRTWANTSDTTYVVTGCVVDGSDEITYDSDGKSMTVPVAYYKVLLRYHKASTISQWSCIAFYTEHKDYGHFDLKSLAISVDELEEIVGIDFFANLPAKLGEARAAELEAQDPKTVSIWW